MSMLEWRYPMSRREIYAAGTFARVFGATRGKDEKQLVLDLPWDTEETAETVTPEERQALTARLRSKSAFGQIRTEATDG